MVGRRFQTTTHKIPFGQKSSRLVMRCDARTRYQIGFACDDRIFAVWFAAQKSSQFTEIAHEEFGFFFIRSQSGGFHWSEIRNFLMHDADVLPLHQRMREVVLDFRTEEIPSIRITRDLMPGSLFTNDCTMIYKRGCVQR